MLPGALSMNDNENLEMEKTDTNRVIETIKERQKDEITAKAIDIAKKQEKKK